MQLFAFGIVAVSGGLTAVTDLDGWVPMENAEIPQEATTGMPVAALRRVAWRKSSYSNPDGDCVELAELVGGKIAVRNSRNPAGSVLIFTQAEIAAFIQGVEQGEFDEVIG